MESQGTRGAEVREEETLLWADPREIVSARVLDAPPERVFQAFSDPQQLVNWWGPQGFRSTFHEFDLRPGGAWRLTMHGPDGNDYSMQKEFVEILPPERVVLRHAHPTHGFEMTMAFTALNQRTELSWRIRFDSEAEASAVRRAVIDANEQNFDRLAAYLAASSGTEPRPGPPPSNRGVPT